MEYTFQNPTLDSLRENCKGSPCDAEPSQKDLPRSWSVWNMRFLRWYMSAPCLLSCPQCGVSWACSGHHMLNLDKSRVQSDSMPSYISASVCMTASQAIKMKSKDLTRCSKALQSSDANTSQINFRITPQEVDALRTWGKKKLTENNMSHCQKALFQLPTKNAVRTKFQAATAATSKADTMIANPQVLMPETGEVLRES